MLVNRSGDCGELLEFWEVQRRLQLGTRVAIGRQEIRVADVIGSVSRTHDFDGCFRPRTQRLRRLLREIRAARPDAADIAILVYQVDHAFFVVDGHKRMSLAIDDGREFIDADVERYPSRFHIDGATTLDDIRATEVERRFREVTGLDVAVPEARFPISDPDAYIDLEESLKAHAYDWSRQEGRLIPPPEAARHWYDYVFLPALEVARRTGVDRVLSSCSEAEVFLLLRGGAGLGEMGPDWSMPQWFVELAEPTLRRAEPRGVPAVIERVTGRARPRPRILAPGDVDEARASEEGEADPEAERSGDSGTSIVRRPRRTVDRPD
jgi:hypothetical protein